MASDINRVVIIGRLSKDPDLRHTQAGMSVASFSVANNRTYMSGGDKKEKKEQVSFFNCVAWGKLGEIITQYCKKGQRIGIEGRLQQRSWEDQEGKKRSTVEIVVENFQFLTPKGEPSGETQIDTAEISGASQEMQSSPFSDDDVPF